MRWSIVLLAGSLFGQNDTSAVTSHAAAASAYMQSGDYAAAERENRIIVRMRPQMAEAEVNLGLSRFLQKHYSDAADALQRGLKLNPDLANAKLFLGMTEFKLNRPLEALRWLEQYAALRPDDFQGQYYLGLCYLARNKFSEARPPLKAAARIDDRNIDVIYHLAQTYLEEAREDPGKSQELAGLYQGAVERIAAIDQNSFRLAQLRAGLFELEGKKTEAIHELETIFQNDPKARGLHYTLGCLYTEQREYSKALQQFEAERKLDSPYFRTDLQTGHVYIALEKPELALPFLERALKMEPDNDGPVWVDIGRAYRFLNQPDKEIRAFEKAIERGQRNASVYYQLASAARRAGNLNLSNEALALSKKLRVEDERGKVREVER